VQAGFEKQEVGDLVVEPSLPFAKTAATDMNIALREAIEIKLPAPITDALPVFVIGAITLDHESQTLTIERPLSEEQAIALTSSLTDEANKAVVTEALGMHRQSVRQEKSPSELGEVFEIPVLALKQGDFFHQFEADDLSDHIDWSLSDENADLTGFVIPNEKRGIKIDITDAERLKQDFIPAGDAIRGEFKLQ